MLERIRTRVNRRGIFNIDRIVPTGSAVKKTSIWKLSYGDRYMEFDFLAFLNNPIKECENQTLLHDCQGCIKIVNLPLKMTLTHWSFLQNFQNDYLASVANKYTITVI